jgi:hypothetical protein
MLAAPDDESVMYSTVDDARRKPAQNDDIGRDRRRTCAHLYLIIYT